ncbi:MAG: Ppx/GppA phosphatase family protein [Ghiorsea sp.]|nr:Ppx/GppA phosphatase family protein [Ghiorsea sp.]
MKQAVLDIGSNTIRLLIAETTGNHHEKLHYQHAIARLGEGLQQTGELSEAGMARAMVIFHEFIAVCQSFSIEVANIKAVATAAIREASNGASFVEYVFTATGLKIQVIDGENEAKLALLGAQSALADDIQQNMLLFDIGGGSTEFSRVCQGQLLDSFSEKLGVVRLTELYLRQDPPSQAEYHAMKVHSLKHLQHVEKLWAHHKTMPSCLVGTAGSVTTLAAIALGMQLYDASQINNYRMDKAIFFALKDKLLHMSQAQRLAIPALEKGREDVIIAGLAIVEALFEYWEFEELVTVDAGLLEGLLLNQKF